MSRVQKSYACPATASVKHGMQKSTAVSIALYDTIISLAVAPYSTTQHNNAASMSLFSSEAARACVRQDVRHDTIEIDRFTF